MTSTTRSVPGRSQTLRHAPPRRSAEAGVFCLALDAVESVDWHGKQRPFGTNCGPSIQPDRLMTLLTYCHAVGVCGSHEIVEQARQLAQLRILFDDQLPDSDTIQRFRQLHQDALGQCLSQVLLQALHVRFPQPQEDAAPVDQCVALALDRWLQPLRPPFPGALPIQGIEQAVLTTEIMID